jgi:hypothetical protein
MVNRIFLRTFLAVSLLVSFICVAASKSDASITMTTATTTTTTRSVAKHVHTVSAHMLRTEASKKSTYGEMVHVPHLLPNGWRRSTEEVNGGTGY